MERLTEDYYDDMQKIVRHCVKSDNIDLNTGGDDFQNIIDKLAEYETAEEEGRLVIFPCKIGTPIYVIDYTWVYGEIGDKAEKRYFIRETPFEYGMIDEFNKTVFLTREEAEKALKEMEEKSEWLV